MFILILLALSVGSGWTAVDQFSRGARPVVVVLFALLAFLLALATAVAIYDAIDPIEKGK